MQTRVTIKKKENQYTEKGMNWNHINSQIKSEKVKIKRLKEKQIINTTNKTLL